MKPLSPSQPWCDDFPPSTSSLTRLDSTQNFSRDAAVFRRLEKLLDDAPRIPLDSEERIVILSDLHLGNGGRRDDYKKNAELVQGVLRDYYLPDQYRLILNGDIEDTQNFAFSSILHAWPEFFEILRDFSNNDKLVKIIGNHDEEMFSHSRRYPVPTELHQAVLFLLKGNMPLFAFHGHHASNFMWKCNDLIGYLTKWIAFPLGFHNYTISHSNTKRIIYERRIYEFAKQMGLIALIGHTHRPLFESMPKVDSLKYQIEKLCREYAGVTQHEQTRLAKRIRNLRMQLQEALPRKGNEGSQASIYDSDVVVPCLFNSGCGIGKRGITALEISDGSIALVHWLHQSTDPSAFPDAEFHPLPGTPYIKAVLRKECLQYIFTRIRLLAK
ncbi:TPA: metallophosphoesterase [Candidatus Sumerlaeota bacterium]|nr:metallophosphoesterase [Candidatus Sumerlaeota bacterium]